jgi:dephospho-CoA kinase
MIIIGLTGGIASGKSLLTKNLLENNIPVLDCDLIARKVVEPQTKGYLQILKTFEKDIPDLLLPNQSINRKSLGKFIFNNEEKRKLLQNITGKEIFKEILKGLAYHFLIGTPVVVIDAPTLYETKFLVKFCKEIIVIAVKPETQLERLMTRDGSTKEEAESRIQSQIPIEEKVKLADVVIWNEGTKDELIEKAQTLAKQLKKQAFGWRLFLSGPGLLCCSVVVVWWINRKWR